MRVPFSDLTVTPDEKAYVNAVLSSGWLSKGKVSDEFQSALEEYLGKGVHVALVNNGSAALMVNLLANGVKAGDTVLVPDFTFIATASVPSILGCKVVPVDVDPETFNLPDNFVNVDTKGIVWTDVAGLPVNLDVWTDDLSVEDGAEALGAEIKGQRIGSGDHLTTFSFQATKQLSTVEGGAIASKNEELIEKCRQIADYGRSKTERYVHEVLGMNFRMTDIQAALGLVQLGNLEENLKRRNEIADRYRKEIVCVPQKVPNYVTRHAYWTFMAAGLRDKERAFLDAGIDVRRSWVPIHMQPWWRESCPTSLRGIDSHNATWLYNNLLMLPIFNSMTNEQVDYVVKVANS